MTDFLQQYQENCRNYVHRTPYRLLRIVFAFIGALCLGGICAFVAKVTGEPWVAMVLGVVGGLFLLAALILFERWLARVVEGPPEVVPAEVVGDLHPVHWQGAPPAKASSGSGCAVATVLAVVAGSALLCCGGGAALVALGVHTAAEADPPQGAAVAAEDSILTFQQQHQRQLEDMVRQQEEQLRQMERNFAPPRP